MKMHKSFRSGSVKLMVIGVLVVALLGVGWVLTTNFSGDDEESLASKATFPVRRQNLTISIKENGNIKALESIDIKCEVEGRTTIISIIDEGTYLTEEDVANGLIICELDSSEVDLELSDQEIDFAQVEADYLEAKEDLDIQKKQNESDIAAGRLKVKFALIDLKKYLGETVAEKVLRKAEQEELTSEFFAGLINDVAIGGEALQSLRNSEAEIDLANEQLIQDENELDWTQRLYEKDYATRNELEKGKLTVKSQGVQVDKARTSLDLFVRYEFPKQSEQLYSDYVEAKRELVRIEAQARSRLAQTDSRLKSREARYRLERLQLEEDYEQKAACIIRAPAAGLVVYGTSGESSRRFDSTQPIEAGTEVRERQKILSIPNLEKMGVAISVHETAVDKVRAGQSARVILDAFPDKVLNGQVTKVATLPAPQSSWLNPDLKVYSTEIAIEGSYEFLRPGMSAQVEILVEQLNDVLIVPVQAVANRQGEKLCYVARDGRLQPQVVQTGSFDENFIVIHGGLTEGELVSLQPPRSFENQTQQQPQMAALTEKQGIDPSPDKGKGSTAQAAQALPARSPTHQAGERPTGTNQERGPRAGTPQRTGGERMGERPRRAQVDSPQRPDGARRGDRPYYRREGGENGRIVRVPPAQNQSEKDSKNQ